MSDGKLHLALHNALDDIPGLITQACGVSVDRWIDKESFRPRYNIGPHTPVLILYRDLQSSRKGDAPWVMRSAKWGRVPSTSVVEDEKRNYLTARGLNVANSAAGWGGAIKGQRCGVICEGFYVFPPGMNAKQYYVKRSDGGLILLAGLYDSARMDADGSTLWSVAIVTTMADGEHLEMHPFLPVIVSSGRLLRRWVPHTRQESLWTRELTALVTQPHDYKALPLAFGPVDSKVKNPAHQSASFILFHKEKDIPTLFSKQAQNAESQSLPQVQGARLIHQGQAAHGPLASTSRLSGRSQLPSIPTSSRKGKENQLKNPSPDYEPDTSGDDLDVQTMRSASPMSIVNHDEEFSEEEGIDAEIRPPRTPSPPLAGTSGLQQRPLQTVTPPPTVSSKRRRIAVQEGVGEGESSEGVLPAPLEHEEQRSDPQPQAAINKAFDLTGPRPFTHPSSSSTATGTSTSPKKKKSPKKKIRRTVKIEAYISPRKGS